MQALHWYRLMHPAHFDGGNKKNIPKIKTPLKHDRSRALPNIKGRHHETLHLSQPSSVLINEDVADISSIGGRAQLGWDDQANRQYRLANVPPGFGIAPPAVE